MFGQQKPEEDTALKRMLGIKNSSNTIAAVFINLDPFALVFHYDAVCNWFKKSTSLFAEPQPFACVSFGF